MAKTLKEAPLTTRNARAKLVPGLYWRSLDPEVHLGYRKAKAGGVWLVRWRTELGYNRAQLGTADDVVAAGTLDYEAARRAARDFVQNLREEAERERERAEAEAAGRPVTVRDAVERYIEGRDARDRKRTGRQVRSDASRRLSRYILGQPARGKAKAIPPALIASVDLAALTDTHLLEWRAGLPNGISEATRQRLNNDFKAALNAAFASNRGQLPDTLLTDIRLGLKAPAVDDESDPIARDNQILSDGDIARLIRASREIDEELGWKGDLFRMVVVLAATGARFSQVARLRVGDCQIGARRLMMPVSRKGKRKASASTATPIPVGSDVLDTLVSVATGRKANQPLLERWRYKQIAATKWERTDRGQWQAPAELTRPWKAIRERAGLPEVIPYALRHSSIVRGIKANLPIRLVASLHDTSIAMIERHYGAHVTDGLEELSRSAIVPLVPPVAGGQVVRLRGEIA